MQIAIVGPGRIGSAFAFHLARAGHDVTVVGRGQRLAELEKDPAITAVDGERAPVKVASALDPAIPYDLVLVTVLAHQSDALLPALKASAAKAVMFMFNTFETSDRRRDAVGADRAVFAFPQVIASFVDGKLKSSVKGPGLVTTMSSAAWARVFADAGLPTAVEPDMDAYLRSHAAFFVPLMAGAALMHGRKAGLSWSDAKRLAGAMAEGFGVVRGLGHKLTPAMVANMARLPSFVLTSMIWAFSKTAAVRDMGAFGPGEAQALIDAMAAAAPGKTPKLLAIRP